MLVIVQHTLTDLPAAFERGERLKAGEGAPEGTRVLQFFPSQDGALVTCLWESNAVADVQGYVDETLRDSSVNLCYAVEESAAFAQLPAGIARQPALAGA
jgi:hypothetical protein